MSVMCSAPHAFKTIDMLMAYCTLRANNFSHIRMILFWSISIIPEMRSFAMTDFTDAIICCIPVCKGVHSFGIKEFYAPGAIIRGCYCGSYYIPIYDCKC